MHTLGTRLIITLAAISLCSAAAAPHSSAQCSSNTPAFMDIGLTPNNPFQAEKVTKRTGPTPMLLLGTELHAELIVRDSQGRVRIERITGKYKLQSGPDQGQELEQHIISICDPIAQTLTLLDTINKTARILPSRSLRPGALSTPQIPLCTFKAKLIGLRRSLVEDLGHQNIQGFDAQGFRYTMTPQLPAAQENGPSSSTREEWCAEELSAVLLDSLSSSRGAKSDISLTKIERIEPDPTLFQIPPDYTISERIPSPSAQRSVSSLRSPNGSTTPIALPHP